jgi:hypothetical protein
MKKVLLKCLEKEYSNGFYTVRKDEVFCVPEFEAERLLADFPESFEVVDAKKYKGAVGVDLYDNPPSRWKILYKDVFNKKEAAEKPETLTASDQEENEKQEG